MEHLKAVASERVHLVNDWFVDGKGLWKDWDVVKVGLHFVVANGSIMLCSMYGILKLVSGSGVIRLLLIDHLFKKMTKY